MTGRITEGYAASSRAHESYSISLSYGTVFITFAIISTLLCGSIPSLRQLMSEPISIVADGYTFTGVSKLLGDAFSAARNDLFLLFFAFVGALSVAPNTVNLLIVSYRGVSTGALLFSLLSQPYRTVGTWLSVSSSLLISVIVVFAAVSSFEAQKRIMKARSADNSRRAFKISLILFFLFTAYAGAICLIHTARYIL